MSCIYPVWTMENSGIAPQWLCFDVTPIFTEVGKPCIVFGMTAVEFTFVEVQRRVSFVEADRNPIFSKICH